MTHEDRLNFLNGRVTALMNFVAVLANTHHDPVESKQHLEISRVIGYSQHESKQLKGAFRDGMNDANLKIDRAVELAAHGCLL